MSLSEWIGLATAIFGGYWALATLVVAQFEKRLDERFTAQEKSRDEGRKLWDVRFTRLENQQRDLERDLLGLKADLPVNYIRREDHIRFETTINAKLDAVMARIELVGERLQKG